MATRLAAVLILCFALSPVAWSQTVRFDTNVGNIDLTLNPTGNANLVGHVDNILRYIESGRYEGVVINRADIGGNPDDPSTDFVLQMGGFLMGDPIYSSFDQFLPVNSFDPVIVDGDGDGQVDFDTTDLSNTRGTVSLALSANPNTGTSSFFVNVGDNEFLDNSGFVAFAQVLDMSTVDHIMRLDQINDPSAGLASANIPVISEFDELVFVERAYCLGDCEPVPVSAPAAPAVAATISEGGGGTDSSVLSSTPSLNGVGVPEPATLTIALGGLLALASRRRR